MKLFNIIAKNLKLLLRSSVSSLVLIMGPLLVIVLVGVSFSTNTYNLKIDVFSEKYSELSNSLIDKLASEKYNIEKSGSEAMCVGSVISGDAHACVVFPPEMDVENQRVNKIRFYVDQSKVNLVYLVMSTLTSSVGETSSQISKDLTQKVVSSLLSSKDTVAGSINYVEQAIISAGAVSEDSDSSKSTLQSLDLSPETEFDFELQTAKVRHELDKFITDAADIVSEGIELADDLEPWVEQNGTATLNKIKSSLEDLNSTLKSQHNLTSSELVTLVEEIESSISILSAKLETAQYASNDVILKMDSVKAQAASIQQNAQILKDNMNKVISDVYSIEITNVESIVSPITTEINTVVKSQNNLGFLFPSLIVMLIMFIGIFMSSTLVIMEKNSKASFRVFNTPTKKIMFDAATYLTGMLLLISQVMIILIASQVYFSIDFLPSFGNIIISLVLIMSFFILLGMLVGYIFKTEEIALLTGVSIASLMLLTSGIIFPLESMPSYIAQFAEYNPVVVSTNLFKRSFLFESGLDAISGYLWQMAMLLASVLILILIAGKSDYIKSIIKRPAKNKVKSDWIYSQFDFGGRKAKTLAEFIVSIQNKSPENFNFLMGKNAFYEWLLLVYKHKDIASKVHNLRTKEELLKVLIDELKRLS